MKIPVMEVFGPTIQGEGIVIGQKTMFVRTGGCDYRCSWCDSSFTWDGTGKSELMEASAIVTSLKEIGDNRFSHVTISGGNPALHRGLGEFVSLCHQENWTVAIETQGSIWQDWLFEVDEVTVSPKPPSSNMETDYTKLDYMLSQLSINKVSLKVVIFDERDFDYALHIHKRYPEVRMFLQVGNNELTMMDNDQLISKLLQRYEWLVEQTLRSSEMNNVRVLPQLHTFLWGNKRGV
ncbi:7-carboxy-7-deazaguanine synthase QueE [Bacillus sp. JCM 19034]|uniref:7-carboxy-7-deazaguanine synthase QueE n=1 Tax=Bacillus sp. JCM 19034 TaxID=1481928 RepID=UPI000784D7B6|nr:7-carboxy-7-deazaguanine synthase QueE [Bacillus sp. JCM 19034]